MRVKSIPLAVFFLIGCDGSPVTTPKIAESQREALERSRDVEETLHKSHEESQTKIRETEEK
jgi:hypothetical protein